MGLTPLWTLLRLNRNSLLVEWKPETGSIFFGIYAIRKRDWIQDDREFLLERKCRAMGRDTGPRSHITIFVCCANIWRAVNNGQHRSGHRVCDDALFVGRSVAA